MTFFIDSNFFLQCKKYDQLNWSDITTDKDNTVLITRPVQIEIDRLKNDGNSRRAKRARETTSFFRQILAEDALSIHFNLNAISVTFKFANNYSDDVLLRSNPSLDMLNPDDKILATLNMYLLDDIKNEKSNVFLSYDTNPLLTAKVNHLPFIEIPETWLLEPENDERDKEIQKLKQQVLEYQKKEPRIELKFNSNDRIIQKPQMNEFEAHIYSYKQIDHEDIEKLVDSFLEKHPKKTNFNEDESLSGLNRMAFFKQTYYPPDDNKIEKYNVAYQEWKNDLYEVISNYADKKNKYSHIVPFCVILKNTGNLPADNLLLDFEILTGGMLVKPDFDDKVLARRLAYPTPPIPPQGEWKDSFLFPADRFASLQSRIFSPNLANSIEPTLRIPSLTRDKNTFYWKGGRPDKNITSWRFECTEFRHKHDDELFSYYIIFDEDNDKIVLRVRGSASNMSSPVEETYILKKRYIYIEAKNDILHLLKCGVTEKVMKKIEGRN